MSNYHTYQTLIGIFEDIPESAFEEYVRKCGTSGGVFGEFGLPDISNLESVSLKVARHLKIELNNVSHVIQEPYYELLNDGRIELRGIVRFTGPFAKEAEALYNKGEIKFIPRSLRNDSGSETLITIDLSMVNNDA